MCSTNIVYSIFRGLAKQSFDLGKWEKVWRQNSFAKGSTVFLKSVKLVSVSANRNFCSHFYINLQTNYRQLYVLTLGGDQPSGGLINWLAPQVRAQLNPAIPLQFYYGDSAHGILGQTVLLTL